MTAKVKICGITSVADALLAAEAGADAIGLVFYPHSPRFVEAGAAREIVRALPPFVSPVGVFVNEAPATVEELCTAAGIRIVQLHGSEEPEYVEQLPEYRVIKAIRVGRAEDLLAARQYRVSAVLLDSKVEGLWGGSGRSFDWTLARQLNARIILAGGLAPDNVAQAIRLVKPYAVDVSTGVEAAPGRKDPALVRAFVAAVRTAR